MKAREVTRTIKKHAERELWGRAAGRCQFDGCNKPLYKHGVTQEPVNLAEMAHIYSFSENGPRGWGPFRKDRSGINDVSNLLLVCHDCHKLIDEDQSGDKYSADLLKKWKEEQETRISTATGIHPSKRSHVVLYDARIGNERSPLDMGSCHEAMSPCWNAADERPITLSMRSDLDEAAPAYWEAEVSHLQKVFDRMIRPRIDEAAPNHFSLFALAPQPLLIQLGALFTDKVPVEVYQPIREPRTWKRQQHPEGFEFIINQPKEVTGAPVVLFSLSDKVNHQRIYDAAGSNVSIWEVTSTDCHNDFLRSEQQLRDFRRVVRKLFVDLREGHPNATEILIFPIMPVACAIELGRVRMPKADLPWEVFDQGAKQKPFVSRLRIGGENK